MADVVFDDVVFDDVVLVSGLSITTPITLSTGNPEAVIRGSETLVEHVGGDMFCTNFFCGDFSKGGYTDTLIIHEKV